jgi:trk system potassium uptake protein TrkA
MKIIVIGDGKVGRTIVEHICKEGHEVTIIDKDSETVDELVNSYDVLGVCGNGASYDVLKEAGADKADLVVATTTNDETNILSCLISEKMGAKASVARVRSYEYNNQLKIIKNDLGIDLPINPEKETANEITKILNFPEALRVDTFAKGHVDLVELFIPENNPLVGESLLSVYQKYQIKVLVCAVERGNDVFIPTGSFILNAKDKIYVTANSKATLRKFIDKVSLVEKRLKNVLIIGGGKISAYLGKELEKGKFNVKIVEVNKNRCLELSELLPNANIIHGDGTDQDLLIEEGINDMDAVVALTNRDEENIILSMYANQCDVKKIITKVNRKSLIGLMDHIDLASVVSTKEVTTSRILSYIRAINNTRGSNVRTLYKLVNNKVEALEFKAKENKRLINIPLRDLKLKENILIAAIIHENEVIIPSGNDVISVDDNVIVVTTNQYLKDLNEILE